MADGHGFRTALGLSVGERGDLEDYFLRDAVHIADSLAAALDDQRRGAGAVGRIGTQRAAGNDTDRIVIARDAGAADLERYAQLFTGVE